MADSQKLALEFQQNGFVVGNKFNEPDVYIINSCTITANADRTARQAANYAKKQWPNSLVVMTGCYAERDPKGLNFSGYTFKLCLNAKSIILYK